MQSNHSNESYHSSFFSYGEVCCAVQGVSNFDYLNEILKRDHLNEILLSSALLLR